MSLDPIVQRFQPFSGPVAEGRQVDCLGVMFEDRLFNPDAELKPAREVQTELLAFSGEAYFDWLEMLRAVDAAKDTFTMIELGAGYGYWLSQGAAAARQRGLKLRLTALEAEPSHHAMLLRHLAGNGILESEHDLRFAAVAAQTGEAWFETGEALSWWGQSVIDDPDAYVGQSKNLRRVPAYSLTSILEPLDHVDLLHMDVQGVELEVLTAAFAEVERCVSRIIIGTHGHDIEDGLRALFRGWTPVYDFKFEATNATEYGDCLFGDGLQVWRNPKFTA